MNGQQFIEMISERKNAKQGSGRIDRLCKLAIEHDVDVAEVTVVINRDYQWNTRNNRTPDEAKAVIIGQTNSTRHGHPLEIIWAYVKEA